MANYNFGVVKATFSNYMNESENVFAKEMFTNFMKLIKESKIFKAQFQIYNNLEDKHIVNENLAIKYIDENINLLKQVCKAPNFEYANKELAKVCEGLTPRVSEKKRVLYENIHTLINQSLQTTNVDELHDSFTFVLNYLTTNKSQNLMNENTTLEYSHVPKDFLIKKAIEKFNTRYESLDESDKAILKSIVSTKLADKETLFTSLKNETLSTLTSLMENSPQVDISKVKTSMTKINEMVYNDDTYSTDIISLNELKKSLL